MTFDTALQNLVAGRGDRDENLSIIRDLVEPRCRTATRDERETTLWDWLAAGDYNGTETPESLAGEWDEIG